MLKVARGETAVAPLERATLRQELEPDRICEQCRGVRGSTGPAHGSGRTCPAVGAAGHDGGGGRVEHSAHTFEQILHQFLLRLVAVKGHEQVVESLELEDSALRRKIEGRRHARILSRGRSAAPCCSARRPCCGVARAA